MRLTSSCARSSSRFRFFCSSLMYSSCKPTQGNKQNQSMRVLCAVFSDLLALQVLVLLLEELLLQAHARTCKTSRRETRVLYSVFCLHFKFFCSCLMYSSCIHNINN
jgi:hypothetical protein